MGKGVKVCEMLSPKWDIHIKPLHGSQIIMVMITEKSSETEVVDDKEETFLNTEGWWK